MTSIGLRRATLTLLAAVAVVGCDSLVGPEDPASLEISASRTRMDAPGDTIMFGAVVIDDRGNALPDASVSWESSAPGVAAIDPLTGLLTAVSDGTTRVVARSGSTADSLEITVETVIPCAPVGELLFPDTIPGSVADTDCRVQGSTGDFWRLTLAEETEITIELRSSELDAVLVVFDGRGDVIAVDDDGGIGLNSRIFLKLPAGTYFVFATSLFADGRGPYQLSAFEGAFPSPCPATASIGLPATVTGRVDQNGCNFEGFYIDAWRLDLDTDTTVIVRVSSDELVPGIRLADTLGAVLAGTARGPGNDAWLEVPLTAGSYDIWVGDAGTRARTGSYTLATRLGPSLLTCETVGTVAVGETVSGSLTPDDCFLFQGAADGWDLQLEDSAAIDLALRAEGLTPTILVSDSRGELLHFLDGDASLARGEVTLGPGDYRVWARALYDHHGDYSLALTEAGRLPDCDAEAPVAPGDTIQGDLDASDCRLPDGRFADMWTLRLDTPATLTIGLESGDFDAFLILADSLGRTLDRDDDAGGDGNALLTVELAPGSYQLWATSYDAGETGAYDLSVVPATTGSAGAVEPWPPGPPEWPQWGTGSNVEKSSGSAMGLPRIVPHPDGDSSDPRG